MYTESSILQNASGLHEVNVDNEFLANTSYPHRNPCLFYDEFGHTLSDGDIPASGNHTIDTRLWTVKSGSWSASRPNITPIHIYTTGVGEIEFVQYPSIDGYDPVLYGELDISVSGVYSLDINDVKVTGVNSGYTSYAFTFCYGSGYDHIGLGTRRTTMNGYTVVPPFNQGILTKAARKSSIDIKVESLVGVCNIVRASYYKPVVPITHFGLPTNSYNVGSPCMLCPDEPCGVCKKPGTSDHYLVEINGFSRSKLLECNPIGGWLNKIVDVGVTGVDVLPWVSGAPDPNEPSHLCGFDTINPTGTLWCGRFVSGSGGIVSSGFPVGASFTTQTRNMGVRIGGSLTPDSATGVYTYTGEYNGQSYYDKGVWRLWYPDTEWRLESDIYSWHGADTNSLIPRYNTSGNPIVTPCMPDSEWLKITISGSYLTDERYTNQPHGLNSCDSPSKYTISGVVYDFSSYEFTDPNWRYYQQSYGVRYKEYYVYTNLDGSLSWVSSSGTVPSGCVTLATVLKSYIPTSNGAPSGQLVLQPATWTYPAGYNACDTSDASSLDGSFVLGTGISPAVTGLISNVGTPQRCVFTYPQQIVFPSTCGCTSNIGMYLKFVKPSQTVFGVPILGGFDVGFNNQAATWARKIGVGFHSYSDRTTTPSFTYNQVTREVTLGAFVQQSPSTITIPGGIGNPSTIQTNYSLLIQTQAQTKTVPTSHQLRSYGLETRDIEICVDASGTLVIDTSGTYDAIAISRIGQIIESSGCINPRSAFYDKIPYALNTGPGIFVAPTFQLASDKTTLAISGGDFYTIDGVAHHGSGIFNINDHNLPNGNYELCFDVVDAQIKCVAQRSDGGYTPYHSGLPFCQFVVSDTAASGESPWYPPSHYPIIWDAKQVLPYPGVNINAIYSNTPIENVRMEYVDDGTFMMTGPLEYNIRIDVPPEYDDYVYPTIRTIDQKYWRHKYYPASGTYTYFRLGDPAIGGFDEWGNWDWWAGDSSYQYGAYMDVLTSGLYGDTTPNGDAEWYYGCTPVAKVKHNGARQNNEISSFLSSTPIKTKHGFNILNSIPTRYDPNTGWQVLSPSSVLVLDIQNSGSFVECRLYPRACGVMRPCESGVYDFYVNGNQYNMLNGAPYIANIPTTSGVAYKAYFNEDGEFHVDAASAYPEGVLPVAQFAWYHYRTTTSVAGSTWDDGRMDCQAISHLSLPLVAENLPTYIGANNTTCYISAINTP